MKRLFLKRKMRFKLLLFSAPLFLFFLYAGSASGTSLTLYDNLNSFLNDAGHFNLITFDDLADETVLGNQYQYQGVTFVPSEGTTISVDNPGQDIGTSGVVSTPNVLSTKTAGYPDTLEYGIFSVLFTPSTRLFGAYFIDVDQWENTTRFTVYDKNSEIIPITYLKDNNTETFDTFYIPKGYNNEAQFFGVIGDGGISRVDITLGDPNDEGATLDNLYHNFAPVPEPSCILLLSSGLIGIAGLRRKFKKS